MRRLMRGYVWCRWRLDIWQFASQRADYLDYLHAVLSASAGRLTLRELFDRDARRHGDTTARGRLSLRWSRLYEASGGDLPTVWRGCFPEDELMLLATAQSFGHARLLDSFQALSRHLGLLIEARRILWATLGAAIAALGVVSVLLIAIPFWTIPALEQAFSGLPLLYQGPWARRLFVTAEQLQRWGLWIPLGVMGAAAYGVHALPNRCGRLRAHLDRYGPWRLYRQVQAMRLLALVSILLQPGVAGGSPQLRPMLALLHASAAPWLRSHLHQMLVLIDQGWAGSRAFQTGLLDRDVYGFLRDLDEARGLQAALWAVQQRMAGHWLNRMRLQAQVLRWGVLLLGVATVLGIGLWHYAAIDELRRGWMMFHAGQ